MRTSLDGHTVRDLSSSEHGIRVEHTVIEGRSPEQNYHRNGLGVLMIQVLNRHGHILLNTPEGEQVAHIRSGDTLYIDPQEEYAFEGSMTMLRTELPVKAQDT